MPIVVTNVTCAKDALKAAVFIARRFGGVSEDPLKPIEFTPDEVAEFIARMFGVSVEDPLKPIGFMPGSGWGLAVKLENEICLPLHEIPGLEILAEYPVIKGHERSIKYGTFAGRKVIIVSRLHMYEDESRLMVRLIVEMLAHLVDDFIITSGCGSLTKALEVGQIGIVDGFINGADSKKPHVLGDTFVSAEDGFCKPMMSLAHKVGKSLIARYVAHWFVLGPGLEGRLYEKRRARLAGADVIGMSGLPEGAVWRLFREIGKRCVFLVLVTNDDVVEHCHDDVTDAGAQSAAGLADFLERYIKELSSAKKKAA